MEDTPFFVSAGASRIRATNERTKSNRKRGQIHLQLISGMIISPNQITIPRSCWSTGVVEPPTTRNKQHQRHTTRHDTTRQTKIGSFFFSFKFVSLALAPKTKRKKGKREEEEGGGPGCVWCGIPRGPVPPPTPRFHTHLLLILPPTPFEEFGFRLRGGGVLTLR